MNEKKRGATALIYNEFGQVLAVSRKHDHQDFGLPGGKLEPGESPEEAIRREVLEETGLTVTWCKEYFTREDGEFVSTTFLCGFIGHLKQSNTVNSEGAVVKWTKFWELEQGSFGAYNSALHEFTKRNPFFQPGDMVYLFTGETFSIKDVLKDRNSIFYLVHADWTNHKYFVLRHEAFRVMFDFLSNAQMYIAEHELSENTAKHYAFVSHLESLQYYGKGDNVFLYSYHLKGVRNVGYRFIHLIPEGDWRDVESGIYVHDVIEDARQTFNDVKDNTDLVTAEAAFALTEEKGRVRADRSRESYHAGIAANRYGEFRKLCDTIFNVEEGLRTGSSMVKKYRQEFPKVKHRLWKDGTPYQEMWDHLAGLLNLKFEELKYVES